jgi:hypothetical protein
MKMRQSTHRLRASMILSALFLGTLPGLVQAQTTFDVIGPHEYDLPVDFEPFNVFVQYAYYQRNNKTFDTDGDRVDGPDTTALVGLSKYVRFWSPESNRKIGLAWEVIVPEISVRDDKANTQSSGLGDPMTGFAIWYKPAPNATLGFQSFLQIPAGSSDVSDTNWKNLSSVFWDWRFSGQFNWTGDAGFVFQSERNDDTEPGTTFHTNHRFSHRSTELLEPFVALDYERRNGTSTVKGGHVVDAGLGVMLHTFDNQSISLRYSRSISGENHAANNSFNLKYAYVW